METAKTIFKKITVDSALDELMGSVSAGAGLVATSVGMKMINQTGKVNPWLTPLIAFTAGYGIRLAFKNDTIKDIGTGVLLAGTLDGAKKVFNKFAGKNQIVDTINQSIPNLSGNDVLNTRILPQNLRGDYSEAVLVNSPRALLR